MKFFTYLAVAVAGLALSSCNTARSVGNAAGGAVKATGNAVGGAAQSTLDAGKKVGNAVKEDVSAVSRVATGS